MINTSVQILEDGKPIEHMANKQESESMAESNKSISPDRLARVRYGIGMTINIGNYQTARVDVSVELPSDVGRINDTYDIARDYSNDRLMEEIEVLKTIKGGK